VILHFKHNDMGNKLKIKNDDINALVKEALEKVQISTGDEAKKKLEVYKTYIEFKRNKYLFWNAIILSLIALTNISIQIIKLLYEK
jgi:hypothetical protein